MENLITIAKNITYVFSEFYNDISRFSKIPI